MLSKEELELFDEDFKHFLIINGVKNEDWLEMNKTNLDKAMELVKLFSDTVLQKVYEKLRYIEYRSADSCMVFHCAKEQIELISINKIHGSDADLSTVNSIHYALNSKSSDLTIFKTSKLYKGEREVEIHRMIEQGCLISSEEFWLKLNELIA